MEGVKHYMPLHHYYKSEVSRMPWVHGQSYAEQRVKRKLLILRAFIPHPFVCLWPNDGHALSNGAYRSPFGSLQR